MQNESAPRHSEPETLRLFRPSFPFDPGRLPVFYGWIILAMGTVGTVMSIPGQTMGVSVFTDPLIGVLSLSRLQLSLAYLIGTIASAFLLPSAGKLYDRFGARITGSGSAFLLGAVLLLLATVDRISAALGAILPFLPPWFAPLLAITVGFFGIRFFGQGALTMVSRNMTMKWFERRRGFANALMGVFIAFGFSSAPRLLDLLIVRFGWRGAWVVLGLTIGLGFAFAALVFFRDNPEECGLLPDGGPVPAPDPPVPSNPPDGSTAGRRTAAAGSASAAPARGFTLPEARGTYAFWIFTFGLALFSLFFTAVTFHVVSIFERAGLPRTAAIGIFLPASAVSVLFHFGGGWLSDFIRLKYLLILELVGVLLAATGLLFLGPGWPVPLLILGYGISNGMFGVLAAVTWPRFFGRSHLGAISGFAMGWLVAGSAVGPYLFSLSLTLTGGYRAAAFGGAAAAILLLAGTLRANGPGNR